LTAKKRPPSNGTGAARRERPDLISITLGAELLGRLDAYREETSDDECGGTEAVSRSAVIRVAIEEFLGKCSHRTRAYTPKGKN
jgi:metal-responsive CopG/Arc/MetJ family transcriptional regulator